MVFHIETGDSLQTFVGILVKTKKNMKSSDLRVKTLSKNTQVDYHPKVKTIIRKNAQSIKSKNLLIVAVSRSFQKNLYDCVLRSI